MKTKNVLIAALAISLAACGNNSRNTQSQSVQEAEVPDEPAMTEIREIGEMEDTVTPREESIDTILTDTLQFFGSGETEDGFYESFLTKNFEILRMYPMEDRFEEKDMNKLFFIRWRESKYPDGREERSVNNRNEIPGAQPYMTRRHYSEEDSYTNVFEDTYKAKTLKQVYDIIVRNEQGFNDHLRKKLPSGNTDYKSNELGEDVEIAYRFKNRKQLAITLNYPGGVTIVEIEESPGKTVSKITYSAD